MKILVTAGPVYGRLDDNKVVSNRVRGLWATRFANYLVEAGHRVTLLLPDTIKIPGLDEKITVIQHSGYQEYADLCETLAFTMDAAVMASAVVNWIPSEPVKGKMKTEGYSEGDIINIPFVLAPRVINRMRELNPKLTLIGCKMLSGSTEEKLIEAAEHVLEASKAHVVVANDLQSLKHKKLVFPDGAVFDYRNDFDRMFKDLLAVLEDKHYSTVPLTAFSFTSANLPNIKHGLTVFDAIVQKYRNRFTLRHDGKVFGAIAVPVRDGWLVSPRTKGKDFSANEAIYVAGIMPTNQTIIAMGKASMNAPLMIRLGQHRAPACPILHLHEQLPGLPALPYAPPGTVRDSHRALTGPAINIEGHGFIAALDPITLEVFQVVPE